MAEYLIQDTTLTGIADAIRAKTGDTSTISVPDMADKISGISDGGAPETCTVELIADSTYATYGVYRLALGATCYDASTGETQPNVIYATARYAQKNSVILANVVVGSTVFVTWELGGVSTDITQAANIIAESGVSSLDVIGSYNISQMFRADGDGTILVFRNR